MATFDDQSARRISKTVREHERRQRGRRQQRARWHGRSGRGFGEPATLTEDLTRGSYAIATFLVGANRDETGETFAVYDLPAFIGVGKKLASGGTIRVQWDRVARKWVLLTTDACEVDA